MSVLTYTYIHTHVSIRDTILLTFILSRAIQATRFSRRVVMEKEVDLHVEGKTW